MTYTSAECTVKTADDGQRNCPKHVEFLDKNKFGKLVLLLVLLKRDHLISVTQLYVLSKRYRFWFK